MIRRVADLTLLLVFAWASMLLGLWFIASFVVPLELPGPPIPLLTGTLRVAASAALFLAWLLIWRWMVRRMFWRTLRRQQRYSRELGSDHSSRSGRRRGGP